MPRGPGRPNRAGAVVVVATLILALGACGGGSGSNASTVAKTATNGTITVGAYDLYFVELVDDAVQDVGERHPW